MKTIELHPLCLALPEMPENEYLDLRANIAQIGLLEPVVTLDGMILDGRHRYRACVELGIDPRFEEFDGKEDPVDYVWAKNGMRRHMDEGQRGMVMARLLKFSRGRPKSQENAPTDAFIGRKKAAEKAGVGEKTIERSMKVDRKGAPELAEAVMKGEVSVSAAAKVVDTLPDHEAQREALNQAKDNPRKIVEIAKQTKEKPKPREYITLTQWQQEKMTEVPAPTRPA